MQQKKCLTVAVLFVVLACALQTAGAASSKPQRGDILAGVAYAIDGDTIRVGKVHVRLQGVAAPEMGEQGGQAATDFMKRLVNGRQVSCEPDGTRSHERVVGICYLNGKDIGAEVIAAGLARDCPRFSKGRYKEVERARAASLANPKYCRTRRK